MKTTNTIRMIGMTVLLLIAIGMTIAIYQPNGCSPFIGVVLVCIALALSLIAWAIWHFVKYD